MEMYPPDPALQAALRATGREAVIERQDRLEEMVGGSRLLVADHLTLADALLVGVARRLEFYEVESSRRWPKLAALRQRLEVDPAVVHATALEAGEAHQGGGACLGHVPLAGVIERFGS
jgi:glutathione S-transferase